MLKTLKDFKTEDEFRDYVKSLMEKQPVNEDTDIKPDLDGLVKHIQEVIDGKHIID